MTSLMLILITCSLLLALTGAISPLAAALLVVSGGAILFVFKFQRHRARHQMMRRSHELGATSAIALRHLGGLPFPVPSPVNLFVSSDLIRFETDHDLWQFSRHQVCRIALATAEQLHRLPDQEILQALSGGTSRLLSLTREKIRRSDSAIRHADVLFMTYRPETDNPSDTPFEENELLILSFMDRKRMRSILDREGLSAKLTDFNTMTGESQTNGI